MVIGFSLGSLHRILPAQSVIDRLEWLRRKWNEGLNFNAVEIIIPHHEEESFFLDCPLYNWLSVLAHISYHLTHISKDTIAAIKRLPRVDAIVCHIDRKDMLTEEFKKEFYDKVIFENVSRQPIHHYNFKDKDKICFDIAHAVSHSIQHMHKFLFCNHKRIEQLHLSVLGQAGDHETYFNSDKWREYELNLFKLQKFPIIIESSFSAKEEVKKELYFIRGKLS